MSKTATNNLGGSLRFLFAAISALLFFLGENLSLHGLGGLFNSGSLPYFVSGAVVTVLGCVIYLHFVCRRSLLESLAISIPLLIFSIVFSTLVVLRIINSIVGIVESTDIFRGINQSGSFSIGIINILAVNCLALSYSMPISSKLIRLIVAMVVSIILILISERLLVIPRRSTVEEWNNNIESWYIAIYTFAAWLITTFVILYRNASDRQL